MSAVRDRVSNQVVIPPKSVISRAASRFKALLAAPYRKTETRNTGDEMLVPAIETEYVDILFDPKFRASVAQVKDFTCLDIARLANLWNLVRMASPGDFLEVGSFRGGTALHICNAMENIDAAFYCFDPFETGGFESIGDLDQAFKPTDFMDTQYAAVVRLLSSKPRAKVIQGFFPAAAEDLDLHNIAFCHLDVDTYEATRTSLEFMAPRMSPRGLIVLDDVDHRETPGVRKAMMDFVGVHPSFIAIPMFPVQAVLVPKTYWPS